MTDLRTHTILWRQGRRFVLISLLASLALTIPAASAAALGPPIVSSTAAAEVTETTAILSGSVNPNERKVTDYHFEYITQEAWASDGNAFGVGTESTPAGELPVEAIGKGDLASGSSKVTNVSASAGAFGVGQTLTGTGIPAGTQIVKVLQASGGLELEISKVATATAGAVSLKASGFQPVAAQIEGLAPATAYRLRLAATNNQGTTLQEATFATYGPAPGFGPCPNDPFRSGVFAPFGEPSALLPDCRAYEQVSPTDKNGGNAGGIGYLLAAADDGHAATFLSNAGFPGGEGSQALPLYIGSRGAGQWSTQGLLPPPSAGRRAEVAGWLPDFSVAYDRASNEANETALFEHRSDGSGLTQITPYLSDPAPAYLAYVGATPSGSQVAFEDSSALPSTPNALEGRSNVYLWDRDSDQTHLASVMNDGNPPPRGAFAGPYDWVGGTDANTLEKGGSALSYYTQAEHAVAEDGSVFFTAAKSGQLYKRVDPTEPQSAVIHAGRPDEECTEPTKACTLHVSASEKTNGGEDGHDAAGVAPAAFMAATADGNEAFFTSSEKLTNDATTGPEPGPAAIERDTIEGEPENVEPNFIPKKAVGLAEDSQFIYWANPQAGTIGRAKLDGSEVKDEFITGIGTPRYVALGPCSGGGQCIYWTNVGPRNEAGRAQRGKGSIGRATLDTLDPSQPPTDVRSAFIPGEVEASPGQFEEQMTNPQGIAVGPCEGGGECIYWANAAEEEGGPAGGLRTIGRSSLDGSGVRPSFIPLGAATEVPYGMAIAGSHVYWSESLVAEPFFSILRRVDLDGSTNEKTLGGLQTGTELAQIAVDGDHLYWAASSKGAIGRIPLSSFTETGFCHELAGCEEKWIEADGSPFGVAVDASHIHYSVNGETTPNPGNDLYRFDSTAPVGHRLTDLAPDPNPGDPNGAEVLGVLGASDDGEYVYFAANGDLDGHATRGNCPQLAFESAGECNLYLWHRGEGISLVARVRGDSVNWRQSPSVRTGENPNPKTSRLSADGRTLLFSSKNKLTDYDNHGVAELYLFRVGQSIVCVSCNPTGAPPVAGPTSGSIQTFSGLLPSLLVATFLSRNLSASGDQVFFESTEKLVSADTNGVKDVYEWEAPGSGSCTESPAAGYSPTLSGCLYLLSSGTDPNPSYFSDASESGEDAFIFTNSQLVRQDGDQLLDVYDAHVGGGLEAQNEVPKVPCRGEACKPAITAPPQGRGPTTPNFHGPGNPVQKPCRKGKARRHGRCVPAHRRSHKQKKHRRRSHDNRRAHR